MEKLAHDVKNYPDTYQYERAKRLGVSKQGINRALKRLGVTYKKVCATPKPAKKSGASFSKKLKAMSAKAALSFTLMKAALRTTCHARMAMR
ncbi:IS630 transposase-related protein [Nitrosomonas sp. Nm34]|uniref:IS630 transposase-related protein n=1 Tax=Nitrosomonas sp. Nm34 TaxID=1881055 RepID=UPI0008E4E27E|nr:Transposase [Nitrosomonas sp. Nm34]